MILFYLFFPPNFFCFFFCKAGSNSSIKVWATFHAIYKRWRFQILCDSSSSSSDWTENAESSLFFSFLFLTICFAQSFRENTKRYKPKEKESFKGKQTLVTELQGGWEGTKESLDMFDVEDGRRNPSSTVKYSTWKPSHTIRPALDVHREEQKSNRKPSYKKKQ